MTKTIVSSGVDVSVAVFFFQAEDGIRDLTVTGVQTCALPISVTSGGVSPSSSATIWDTIVWWPWPCGVVPMITITRPSGSILTVADSTAPDFGDRKSVV